MNNIISNLHELEKETIQNLGNSKSKNTTRAYKSDFEDFTLFCKKLNLPFMPSNPKTITLYLTHLSKKNKFSTIKRRLSTIKIMHNLKGFHIDLNHPIIKENLFAIKKNIGVIQIGKKPLLINNLFNIIDYLHNNLVNNNVLLLRNKAIVLLGFSGGFRRSELVSIYKSDIEFVQEGMKIRLRKSKTDQFGEGFVKGIPYFKERKYCPVETVREWIAQQKKGGELLFPYSDKLIALIVKKSIESIGLQPSLYSGHSLRSGFATSTASAGADERSIMQMTGHKSAEMVRRYIKDANLFKNNALNKL